MIRPMARQSRNLPSCPSTWTCAMVVTMSLPQLESLDLPGRGLGEGLDEFHPPRILVRGEASPRKSLELGRQLGGTLYSRPKHDEGLRLEQVVLVGLSHHRHLEDAGMRDQHRLDLGGRDPLAARLDHVVRSAAVDVIALGVLKVLIPGEGPSAAECGEALLPVVPITGRAARTAHFQLAELAALHRSIFLVDDRKLVARNRLAGGAVANVVRTKAQENVQHLGGAEAIENVDAEALLPTLADLLGQRFPGRNA